MDKWKLQNSVDSSKGEVVPAMKSVWIVQQLASDAVQRQKDK